MESTSQIIKKSLNMPATTKFLSVSLENGQSYQNFIIDELTQKILDRAFKYQKCFFLYL